MQKIRWGVIGSGKIARRFVSDLKLLPRASIVGVASRNPANAANFGSELGVKPVPSVAELMASDVDVIYVATPHPHHRANAIEAIEAGKAVLCEKPFAMNLRETQAIIELARARNIFVMEAMWTRFFPVIQEVIEVVQAGGIGEIQQIESSFGYHSEFDPTSRVFDPRLGGGSILDVGVYCISLTRMLIEENPVQIDSSATIASTGVDESARWDLKFASGATSSGTSSVVKTLPNEARIVGTTGEIVIPRFWCPNEYRLNGNVRKREFVGQGFQFEADEVMDCFRHEIESPRMSHQHTFDVMRIIDEIRQQCRLYYPGEMIPGRAQSPLFSYENSTTVSLQKTELSEIDTINAIIKRAKSHRNYSPQYLQAALPLLQISPEWLQAHSGYSIRFPNVVGFLGFEILTANRWKLEHLWLEPSFHKKGLGRGAIDFLLSLARREMISEITLFPDPPSEGFYQKMGAIFSGREVASRVANGPTFREMILRP